MKMNGKSYCNTIPWDYNNSVVILDYNPFKQILTSGFYLKYSTRDDRKELDEGEI